MSGAIVTAESELETIVRGMRVVGVVGAKAGRDPDAPAYTIPLLLQRMGIRILPVNPTIGSALGIPTVPDVGSLGERVDVLDVFRRIAALPALADDVLAMPASRRPPVVWFQSGIRDDATAERLAAAGIRVVQDRCLGVYAKRYRR